MSVPEPPWRERATVEVERTHDGYEIVRTRYGLHFKGPDGCLYAYTSPERLADRICRRRPDGPYRVSWDWGGW
jgi:hypothetical protein